MNKPNHCPGWGTWDIQIPLSNSNTLQGFFFSFLTFLVYNPFVLFEKIFALYVYYFYN